MVRKPFILAIIVFAAAFIGWLAVLYINFLADDYGFSPIFVMEFDEMRAALQNTQAGLRTLHPFRPALYVSLWLDYQFYGFDPVGFHLTSLILHAVNAVLFFLVVRLISKNDWMAFAAALIFGMYAGHTEAVGWISARCDALAAFWMLLSILAFLISQYKKHELPLILLSVVFMVIALLSKEVMIAAVPVLAVIASMGRGSKAGKWTWWILETIAIGAFVLFRIWMYGSLAGDMFGTRTSASSHMDVNFLLDGFASDVTMMLSPINRLDTGINEAWFFVLFGAALLLAVWGLFASRRQNMIVFLLGLVWIVSFLAPSLPVGSLVDSMNDSRFLYLPSMGLGLIISIAVLIGGRMKYLSWTLIVLLLALNCAGARHNADKYIEVSEKVRIVDQSVANEIILREQNMREDAIIIVVNIPIIYEGVHFGPALYRPYIDYLTRLHVRDVIFTWKEPEDIGEWHEDLKSRQQFYIVFVFNPETDTIEPF